MAKCIVCGKETGNGSTCQVCGAPTELPSFFNREDYEQWVRVYLAPRREAWRAKKEAQRQAEERTRREEESAQRESQERALREARERAQREDPVRAARENTRNTTIQHKSPEQAKWEAIARAAAQHADAERMRRNQKLQHTTIIPDRTPSSISSAPFSPGHKSVRKAGTLDKTRFRHFANQIRLQKIKIYNSLVLCSPKACDLSSEENGTVLGWYDDGTLCLVGEGGIKAPRDCSELFADYNKLEQIIGIEYLNTSGVASMRSMFKGCSSLLSLNINCWDTSNVTDMCWMFNHCTSLSSLNLNKWNTSRVTDMNSMFAGCHLLKTVDAVNWNTAQITTMFAMFHNCHSLTTLDVSKWNTAKVTTTALMFSNCTSLKALDVDRWNTVNVRDMRWMFENCTGLRKLNAAQWNTLYVIQFGEMFMGVKLNQRPGIKPPIFKTGGNNMRL